VDESRAPEIGEETARGERGGKGIAPEPPRGQQRGVSADLGGEADPAQGRRLAQIGPDKGQNADAHHQKQREVRLPAIGIVQHPADHRADHRHQAHPHGDIADHACGLCVGHHVTDDGAAEDHTRGNDGLCHAEDQEDRCGRGQKRADGGQKEQDQRSDQHLAPPEPVGDRADDDLQSRGKRQIQRNRLLHHAIRHAEVAGHSGQRGQEDVHGQGRKPRQQDQRDDLRRRGPVKEAGLLHPQALRLPGGIVHYPEARSQAHLWKTKKAPSAMKAKPSKWFHISGSFR
jgi:hypothetical protein